MGIELPSELADVAAQTGARWPRADEEAMRTSARAWRQAGADIAALAADADGVATGALRSVRGVAGDAARRHWDAYVDPDAGHLTATAQGCVAAADRLDHAADQVGAAKVAIVGHLVDLARRGDAARLAASAGHPTALAGLDTAIRRTAADIAGVNANLVHSIRSAGAASARRLETVAAMAHGAPATAGSATGPVRPTVTGTASGSGVTAGLPDLAAEMTAGRSSDLPGSPRLPDLAAPGRPGDVGEPLAGIPGDPAGAPPAPGPGPVGVGPVGVGAAAESEPGGPPSGHPPDMSGLSHPMSTSATDHTTAASAAVADRPEAVTAVAPEPSGAAQPAAGDGGLSGSESPPPARRGDIGAGGPVPAGPGAVSSGSGASPAGSVPGSWPVRRSAPTAGPDLTAGPGQPIPGPPGPDGSGGGARSGASGPPPMGDRQWDAGAAGSRLGPPTGGPSGPSDPANVVLLAYLFPMGRPPVAAARPARQLPPPPVDADDTAGLRFPPHDHPDADLIDAARPSRGFGPRPGDRARPGITGDDPRVRALAHGHDPLGGGGEADWVRRYVVRGADPARGIRAEYVWPPGELFPEGGCDIGEALVLEPGVCLDRFGTPEGRVFAPTGTPFARRSLPPGYLDAGYHRYVVRHPLPVWRALSASWFGQPGSGVRYRATHAAADLVALGYLDDVTPDQVPGPVTSADGGGLTT